MALGGILIDQKDLILELVGKEREQKKEQKIEDQQILDSYNTL